MKSPFKKLLDRVNWKPAPEPDPEEYGLLRVTHEGALRIGDARIRVYLLSDGKRVLDPLDLEKFFSDEATPEAE